MFPNIDFSPWPEELPFPHADVYDLVYNPTEALFVRQARAAGLHAQTGLGMLVEQAAFFLMIRPPPRSSLFPFTTLLRSNRNSFFLNSSHTPISSAFSCLRSLES